MGDADVTYVAADGVAVITFDRPEKLNAVRARTRAELAEAFDRAAADADVQAVVLAGNGRAFSAGQDLAELDADLTAPDQAPDPREALATFQALTRQVLDHPKVTLAAIGGVAVGFGAELALACDLRIAGAGARIGFVEAPRGLSSTNGVTWLLPRIVGHSWAAHLMLTGAIVEAEVARQIGLVTALHDEGDVVDHARTLAATVAANAPLSLRLAKAALARTWDEPLAVMLDVEVEGMLACLASEDLATGTAAFLAKRTPEFRDG